MYNKKQKNKPKNTQRMPFVSICTPTFNRRPFIKTMLQCFLNQDYPKSRIEWIIVDDGTDKIKDLIDEANIPQIQYFPIESKVALGYKRNYMHSKTKGSIIVYMDDDDYYPPQRVSHAVETLQKNKDALCAGSSEIYLFFNHINTMYKAGPYGPKHATAGTFAFRRQLLDQTSYEDHAALAEEKHFLKDYTIPFVQLDPFKTILVFSHSQNTFDKRRLLKMESDKFQKSDKTVDMFITNEYETNIKDFFLKEIDSSLQNYKPGDPSLKPDVIIQMKQIEARRDKMIQEANQSRGCTEVRVTLPDGTHKKLSQEEIIHLLQTETERFKKEMNAKDERIKEMENNLYKLRNSSVQNIIPCELNEDIHKNEDSELNLLILNLKEENKLLKDRLESKQYINNLPEKSKLMPDV